MIALGVVLVVVAVALGFRVAIAIVRNHQPPRVSEGWRDEHARGRRDA